MPDLPHLPRIDGRAGTAAARPARGFWTLFRRQPATAGAGERPDAPRPGRRAADTPPWALPPWQYRPGWED